MHTIKQKQPHFLMLLLMISFGSINAVLFTPALPIITSTFNITDSYTQLTISFYLIGYAVGQLFYGPLTSRYGQKSALLLGISLQLLACLICILTGYFHFFAGLLIGRLLLALGAAVGLKMTFTLLSECYTQTEAARITSYLMLAFAVTPALSVWVGGLLISYFAWESCFYALMLYGMVLLIMACRFSHAAVLNKHALRAEHIIKNYAMQFRNRHLIFASFILGCSTSIIYVFAALAPFLVINDLKLTAAEYGVWNLLPAVGLVIGSILSARLIKFYSSWNLLKFGIGFMCLGSVSLLLGLYFAPSALVLFGTMPVIYVGLALMFPNGSSLAMANTDDKAHGSAMMNFINVGLSVIATFMVSAIPSTSILLLPIIFIVISTMAVIMYVVLRKAF